MNRAPVRVILVDDDATVRRALHTALRASGCEVREAGSGKEAVEIAGEDTDLGDWTSICPESAGSKCVDGSDPRASCRHNHDYGERQRG